MNPQSGASLIDINGAEEYRAAEPYRRFIKILLDQETIPDAPLCLAEVRYPPGAKCPPHSHEESAEVYVVLEGELVATIDEHPHQVQSGQLIYIPPTSQHWAENRGQQDCRFMAIHAPPVDDILEVKRSWHRLPVE